jgi:hypothetical protein
VGTELRVSFRGHFLQAYHPIGRHGRRKRVRPGLANELDNRTRTREQNSRLRSTSTLVSIHGLVEVAGWNQSRGQRAVERGLGMLRNPLDGHLYGQLACRAIGRVVPCAGLTRCHYWCRDWDSNPDDRKGQGILRLNEESNEISKLPIRCPFPVYEDYEEGAYAAAQLMLRGSRRTAT